MNYRHAFHAGNFADVFKHVLLTRILLHLAGKPQPFRLLDTHAGAGRYDLSGADAQRTGEWRDGIGCVRDAVFPRDVAALLRPYLDAVAACNPDGRMRFYPGSPLLALHLMRAQDRLVACEVEPGALRALSRTLRDDRRARAVAIDGWQALRAYVPPVERRGLVLVDPPFEAPDEFAQLAQGFEEAHRKWPTGTYLLWYPVKDAQPVALARRLRRSGLPKILRVELHVGARDPERLAATGVIVANPPWTLAEELKALLPALGAALSPAAAPRIAVESLSDQM